MMYEMNVNSMFSKENAEENLYCVVINAKKYEKILKETPHKIVEDLALVVRLRVATNTSVLVTNGICSRLGMSADEVLGIAQANTERESYIFEKMSDFIENTLEIEGMNKDECDVPMYVLTNQRAFDGAVAITTQSALQKVKEIVGEDFYILPSSRHEVILIRRMDFIDVQALRNMVREINATMLEQIDRLSDNVYYYDRISQSIRIA